MSFLPEVIHTDLKMKWKQMVPEVRVTKGRMIHSCHPFTQRNNVKGSVVSCTRAGLSPVGTLDIAFVPGKKSSPD